MYGSMHTIHLIIPSRGDRGALSRLLPELLHQGWPAADITVIDADPPPSPPSPVNWIFAPPAQTGRARQMNLGASSRPADILLFLHADTRLPDTAPTLIRNAVNAGFIGGAFSRRFDAPSRFLRFSCRLADWRGEHLGWFFGDQALFVTREAFDRTGGFPDLLVFEDLELCRQLKRIGPLCLTRPGVLSSARRFNARGPLLTTLHDLWLTLGYFCRPPGRTIIKKRIVDRP